MYTKIHSEKVYTIEEHGKEGEYVVYKGRKSNQHGLNLCTLSNIYDFDKLMLEMVLNGIYSENELIIEPYTLEYYGPEGCYALYKDFRSFSEKPMAIVSDIDHLSNFSKYLLSCLNIHASRMARQSIEKFDCYCGELVNVEEHNEGDHTWYSIKCPKCISSATGPDLSIIDRWKDSVRMEKEQFKDMLPNNITLEQLNNRFNALVKRLGLENDSTINGKS